LILPVEGASASSTPSITGPVTVNELTNNSFTADQHTAVELCLDLTQRIASVTGEAGTGKTMVLSEVTYVLEQRGISYSLCAPTGRAAARIREVTKRRAQTCHRLLGFGAPDPNDPDDLNIPLRDRLNPIPTAVVLVDESSMLSEDLYRALVDALRKNAAIRFFGDIRQLPPVNSDDPPFRRLLERFPKVILTKNFRSGDGIVKAASQINRGSVPTSNDKVKVLTISKQQGLSVLDKFIDDDLFDQKKAQIITPTRVGKLGSAVINNYVQSKINPTGPVMALEYRDDNDEITSSIRIKRGDKILWTKNDYNLNLFNGMIGNVIDFDPLEGAIACEFEGRDIIIPSHLEKFDDYARELFAYDPRKFIDLAYAITTHKSQGSEFDRVIVMLYWSSIGSRQNLYTAITRGRKHVTIIAQQGGFKAFLKNDPALEPRDKK
jgi:exodeoxyribonuclease V alpha subunit